MKLTISEDELMCVNAHFLKRCQKCVAEGGQHFQNMVGWFLMADTRFVYAGAENCYDKLRACALRFCAFKSRRGPKRNKCTRVQARLVTVSEWL